MRDFFRAKNKIFLAVCLMFGSTLLFAQGGASALTNAATQVQSYWEPIKMLIYAIGGVVGIAGGIRIYNKWSQGDQDVGKEIIGWGGSAIFLILVPTFIDAMFA